MATDWSLVTSQAAGLQVPGLVIMADDGAGTVYTVYTVHRPCCTLGLVPGIYVFTAGVAIMTIMTRTRVLQYRN